MTTRARTSERSADVGALTEASCGSLRRGPWHGTSRNGVGCFYGIRFAQLSAPDRPCSAAIAASGQLDVDGMTAVPIFPQLPSRLECVTGPGGRLNPQDDDAFFLNVWAPVAGERLPVLVFVHGGAWASGGGAVRWYRGERLAAEGIVVATLNYRLGPAGHLGDGEAGATHQPFNDLILALQWVKRQIAAFGGDPDRVTLAGQSAGAWYTWALASLPEAAGLFRQAALLSIPQIRPWTPAQRSSFTQRVLTLAAEGAEGSRPDQGRLLKAGALALAEMPRVAGAMPPMYMPVVSGETADILETAVTAAAHSHVEALYVRIVRHEMSAFLPGQESDAAAWDGMLRELRARSAHETIPRCTTPANWSPPHAEAVKLASWLEFGRFSSEIEAETRRRGLRVIRREFAAANGRSSFGAVHCVDLPFQFGNRDDWAGAPMLDGFEAAAFERLSGDVRSDLADFVHGRRQDPDRILGDDHTIETHSP